MLTPATNTPRVGFSFSPGGLLLPYHLGVMDALVEYDWLDVNTPLAGSSAGAIAVAVHGCGFDSKRVLDWNWDIHEHCHANHNSVARGNLLPLLKAQLNQHVGPEQLEQLQQRPGMVGIAYKQVFPRNRSILQTEFETQQDLIQAVCHSSTFPFFSTNFPCALDLSSFPRLVVDGFFTVPRERFGCPDFEAAGEALDRTVTVSVFPQSHIGLDASSPEDCISPLVEEETEERNEEEEAVSNKKGEKIMPRQLKRLFGLATRPTTKERVFDMYDSGWMDAERWCLSQTSAAASPSLSMLSGDDSESSINGRINLN